MSGAIIGRPKRKPGRQRRWALAILALLAAVVATAPRLGLLGWQEQVAYAPVGQARPTTVVFLSGDMGLHLGLSDSLAKGLAAAGYRVTGISSPVAFASHRTPAEAQRIVADAISAATRSGAGRVILAGQSFGADVIATTLPDLPQPLRQRIAGVVLVVPSAMAHLRADPSGIAYIGQPDAMPAAALNRSAAPPITCIRGAEETDSLCPALQGKATRSVVLPGGHYLRRDTGLVIRTMLAAMRSMGG